MAYRGVGMIEAREVPRRFTLGKPVGPIARGIRVDRKTGAKYIAQAPPPSSRAISTMCSSSAIGGPHDHHE